MGAGVDQGAGWLALCALGAVLLAGCQHEQNQSTHVYYSDLVPGTGPVPITNTVRETTLVKQTPVTSKGFSRVTLTNQIKSEWLQPPTGRFTLGPGDKLEIEIMGEPTSRTETIVGPDGKIYFNLLSGVDVWGATLAETKAKLETELAKFVRERPQIALTVRAVESKRVWVLGRVQAPGVYSMTAPMTLLEAVSMAGGTMALSNFQDQEAAGITEELADLRRSFVMRQGHALPVDFKRLLKEGDLTQNIYLQPDDFVYLPATTARQIYVLGAVAQPRPVPFHEGMGVAGAIASAYGTIKGAYMHHVVVIRGSLSNPDTAVIDYRDLINGKAKDIELQPHDIVFVPFSPYRYIQKYIEVAVNTFASAAAINAGEQIFSKHQTGAAGIFIPVGSGVQIIPPVNPPPIQ